MSFIDDWNSHEWKQTKISAEGIGLVECMRCGSLAYYHPNNNDLYINDTDKDWRRGFITGKNLHGEGLGFWESVSCREWQMQRALK